MAGGIESWTFAPGLGVPPPCGAYTHATANGATVYVTGQLPVDPESGDLVVGDIERQTDQVMSNLDHVLGLVGSSMANVVQARSYLRVETDFAGYDRTFRRWFPTRLPSRTTVVVAGFAVAEALVEIDLIASRES